MKFSKYEFWLEKVQFLGHIVSFEEIFINSAKVEVVANWEDQRHQHNLEVIRIERILSRICKRFFPESHAIDSTYHKEWEVRMDTEV